MTERLCSFKREGAICGTYGRGVLGCPAIAAEDSEYCPAHRDQFSGKAIARIRPKREWNPDKDPLPWSDGDIANIKSLRPF